MSTTTDLSKFGHRELKIAGELLTKYCEKMDWTEKAQEYFDEEQVTVMMNDASGNVFLTNEECQVLMINHDKEDKLDIFLSCPECGEEGFDNDIKWDYDKFHCQDCANKEVA